MKLLKEKLIWLLLCVSDLSQASKYSFATSTASAQETILSLQNHPVPTVGPLNFDLRARQQVLLSTCGYIDGDVDQPVTCHASRFCATAGSFIGCCTQGGNCQAIFTACFDTAGPSCDQSCSDNPENLLCSSSLPFCARYNYESDIVGFGCASTQGYTKTVFFTASLALSVPSKTTSKSASTSTASAPPAKASTSLNTGAIAGIAVGAAVGVLALVAGVWFCRRQRKNSKQADQSFISQHQRYSKQSEMSYDQYEYNPTTPDFSNATTYAQYSTPPSNHPSWHGQQQNQSSMHELPDNRRLPAEMDAGGR